MRDVFEYIGVVMYAHNAPITIPPMVSVFTKGIGWVAEDILTTVPVSVSAESNSRVIYVGPIILLSACVVKRVWWINGATTTGGATVQCGIYDNNGYAPGSLLVSGSATQGTANQVQFVDVTETGLSPGLYWIGFSSNSNTNTTFFLNQTLNAVDASFRYQEYKADSTLPATASPSESSVNYLYFCGFSTTSGTTDVPAPPSMVSRPAPVTIPPMVSVFTKGVGWVAEDAAISSPTSAGWSGPAYAYYFPILLPSSCVVKRVWWANGATVSGGATIECGVYADSGSYSPGAKLVSGSATQGTANEVQFVDVTDTSIAPGLYWIALSSSTITNTTVFRCTLQSNQIDAAFSFTETSASPLPSTATPAEQGQNPIWLCGFSTTSSP